VMQCNWEINNEAPSIQKPSKSPPQPPPDPLKATGNDRPLRISYITEQTSHHPPVSAYYVDCPERGVHAQGYDQISAKFTGTAVKVTPGVHNQGIFITLSQRNNEEYQLKHPTASLSGLIRGTMYISVADTCFITCPKTRLKVILQYMEESWLGKSQNKVVGVIYRYDPTNDKYSRIKDVPDKDVLARIDGCWQDKIYWTIPSTAAVKESNVDPTSSKQLLLDVSPLMPVPKIVPPAQEQLPNESRRLWNDVTQAILEKRFGEATKIKQDLEQRQRDLATEREKKNQTWKPRFFEQVTDPSGQPTLTPEGRQVLQDMQHLQFHLEEKPTI